MTEILFNKLRERFPSINDYERISIYGAYERIHLDLVGNEFVNVPYFDSQEKIDNLAKRIFDVNFKWEFSHYSLSDRIPTIIFDPINLPKNKGGTERLMRYQNNYSEHSIEINIPSTHPMITISTGNRGRVDLLDKQREKYYEFVLGVYGAFIEEAKNRVNNIY